MSNRFQEHVDGLIPACYTFKRRPVELVYSEFYTQVHDAITREKQIKGWSRKKKEALINGDFEELKRLARNRQNCETRDGNSGDS